MISDKVLILILASFSFFINYYFGFYGLMPLDDLQNFNSGHRILKGDFPFRDYYSVTGPILDIWQSIFYKLFGVNWKSFVIHASTMNCLYSVSVYHFLKKFNFKSLDAFFYSISSGLLMYPAAGNPTVEHSSLVLSIVSTFLFILGLKDKNFKYIFLGIFIFACSFLTKQVPTVYLIFFCVIVYLTQSLAKINYKNFLFIFFCSVISILIFVFYFYLKKVSYIDIYDQYFILAFDLGRGRVSELNFHFIYENISKLFFLLFLIFPLLILSLKTKNFNSFLIMVGLSIIIITYEIHSNNQPITFSLLPLFLSLFHFEFNKTNIKSLILKYFFFIIIIYVFFRILRFELYYIVPLLIFIFIFFFKNINLTKLIFIYLFIASCFYFERYIVNRTWDELYKDDFSNSFDASIINGKFNNLNWKTAYFKDTKKEKIMIFNTIDYLKSLDPKVNFVLITDYQIYNVILDKKDFSPVKYWFQDATYPNQNHQLRQKFEIFFKSKLISNNISQIIIDNTAKFKSDELSEFDWLNKCIDINKTIQLIPKTEVFFIKKQCLQ